jgi:hypothetical protein
MLHERSFFGHLLGGLIVNGLFFPSLRKLSFKSFLGFLFEPFERYRRKDEEHHGHGTRHMEGHLDVPWQEKGSQQSLPG